MRGLLNILSRFRNEFDKSIIHEYSYFRPQKDIMATMALFCYAVHSVLFT